MFHIEYKKVYHKKIGLFTERRTAIVLKIRSKLTALRHTGRKRKFGKLGIITTDNFNIFFIHWVQGQYGAVFGLLTNYIFTSSELTSSDDLITTALNTIRTQKRCFDYFVSKELRPMLKHDLDCKKRFLC